MTLVHVRDIPPSAASRGRWLFATAHPSRAIWVVLALAAAAVGVAGFLHGRLFHEGYAQVSFVGPLFLLNELGSGAVIAVFLLGRPWLFALGALGISAGSVVSIVISHSTSFLGFAEHRYDARATTIVAAECAAMALVLVAGALAVRFGLGVETER